MGSSGVLLRRPRMSDTDANALSASQRSQTLDERGHVLGAVAQQGRRGGHDVGAGEQELHDLDVAVNARSCGEGQSEAPRQQRDPGERQVDVGGSRERRLAFDAQRIADQDRAGRTRLKSTTPSAPTDWSCLHEISQRR